MTAPYFTTAGPISLSITRGHYQSVRVVMEMTHSAGSNKGTHAQGQRACATGKLLDVHELLKISLKGQRCQGPGVGTISQPAVGRTERTDQ